MKNGFSYFAINRQTIFEGQDYFLRVGHCEKSKSLRCYYSFVYRRPGICKP